MVEANPTRSCLLYPTHDSSPGELTVAGTQDIGRDGLAGRPSGSRVFGFLQIALVGWMRFEEACRGWAPLICPLASGRKSLLSRAPEQSTSTSTSASTAPRQQNPSFLIAALSQHTPGRHSPPTYLTCPSTCVLRANTGPLPVIASICSCSYLVACLFPRAPTCAA
jgi:hypothetical protein